MEMFELAGKMLPEESRQNLNEAAFKEFQEVFKAQGWSLSKIRTKATAAEVKEAKPAKKKPGRKKVNGKAKPKAKKVADTGTGSAFKVNGMDFASVKGFADYCGVKPGTIYAARRQGRDLAGFLPN